MFAPTYFAPTYYPSTYFTTGASSSSSTALKYFPKEYFAPTYFAPSYFPGATFAISTNSASLKEAVITALKAENTITDLVGSRVFPNHPARGAARPSIVVLVASDVRGQSVAGHTSQRIARVLLDCQATTDASAETIARALDSYLPTLGQTSISGLAVKTCIQQSESDTYTQPGTGGDVGVYSRLLDYRFDYRLQS